MPISSVPGFFGSKARQRRPAGVDVVYATDFSGSMNPFINFINDQATIAELEQALIDEQVGILVPNRYCKSSMQSMFVDGNTGLSWQFGSDILASSAIWEDWESTGFRWGASQEDVTGAAYRIANTEFEYGYSTSEVPASNGSVFGPTYGERSFRPEATQILVASSDEQSGGNINYFKDEVYDLITDSRKNFRYVAVSSIQIQKTIPPELAGKVVPFGIVFTSPAVWKIIYRPLVGVPDALPSGEPVFGDVSPNDVQFFANGNQILDTSASGDIELPNATAFFAQVINTPMMARGTQGAVYDIGQFNQPNGPPVFGKSLGLVLGRFLYDLE
jgi:hypothetical protein